MDEEYKLTEAQQRYFDEKKDFVSNLPEDATDREKELAKTALFFVKYAEELQKAINMQRKKAAAAAAAVPFRAVKSVGRDDRMLQGDRPPFRRPDTRQARVQRRNG